MKIDVDTLKYIQNVITTAKLVGIETICIEPGRVRALNEDSTAFILHTKDVPALPFGSISINRIDLFESRYSIARAVDDCVIEAVVAGQPDSHFVRALTMKGKGIKLDYRCANPATVRSPKGYTDQPRYQGRMTPEAVSYMQKGMSAMQTDEVTFIGTSDDLSFEMVDINGDKFEHRFGDGITKVQPADKDVPSCSHRYPVKMLLTLFKMNSTGNFYFTSKGVLVMNANSLDVYLLPRM